MASIAKRVLARALGTLKGGAGSEPTSPSSSPSSALGSGLDSAVETLKGVANGSDVASSLGEQAAKAVEKQEEVAKKASENADVKLVKASEVVSSNIGKPVTKTPEQILAEAEKAGIAEAMAEIAAQKAEAERLAAAAALKNASNKAERIKQEAKAKTIAEAAAAAKAKEEALVAARTAEDAQKATARLGEVKDNLESLVVYLKGADLNSELNKNKTASAKNIGANLDAAKSFLKTHTARYESEVMALKTVESVDAKKGSYEKALVSAEKELATLKSSLNSSKNNSGRQDIVGKLLSANMAAFVLTTAVNRAEERKTELVNAARAENLKAAAAAAGGFAASAAATAASGVGSFFATLKNPTRAAEMGCALVTMAATYYYRPDMLYAAALFAGAAAVNVATTAFFKTDPLIYTIVTSSASTIGSFAGGIFTGLFSKNPEEVKEAKMKLRSASAKDKAEVAKAEKAAVKTANSSPDVPEGETGCKGKPCKAMNVDGSACQGSRGMKLLGKRCVCFTHFNMGDAVKWQKGGTRRGSVRGKRQTRKNRF